MQSILQVALVCLIVVAINYIGMRSYKRHDLAEGSLYSLSPETKAYLARLSQPVDVIVTLSENSDDPGLSDILKDVRLLLREYEYATRSEGENRISVEYLNVYAQSSRAKSLGIEDPNVIVFKSGERKRQVGIHELYTIQDSEIREFLGENVFTRSLLGILDATEPVVYFTTGHGEMSSEESTQANGNSNLLGELKARSLATRKIDLSTARAIPADAALLVVAAPKTRFLGQELLLLEDYLDKRAGRVMVLLEPGAAHGLEDIFFRWGILAEDMIAIERDPNYLIDGGDLIIRRYAEHPLTASLYEQGIPLVTDRAVAVREDPGRPLDDSIVVSELLATSDNSWGERQNTQETIATYDASSDLPGPVAIAAISERKVDSSLGISLPGGKLLVIGSSQLITNQRINSSGNLFLFLNAVNYAIEQDARLNIPPRPIRKFKLDLSIEELHLTRYFIWFGPPAIIGLLGLLVYLARRN